MIIIMTKRVTIMIDDDIDKRVRSKQAELIKKTTSSVSFSKVINQALRGKIKI